MAIRKKGNVYFAYFSFLGRVVARSLGTADLEEAKRLEHAFKIALDAQRRAMRLAKLTYALDLPAIKTERARPSDFLAPPSSKSHVTLAALFPIAEKRSKLSTDSRAIWETFCKVIPCKYAADLTPQMAQEYMDSQYGEKSAKRYNNVLCVLKIIYKLALVEVGLPYSPLENLQPRRPDAVEHYRAFTAQEVMRIFDWLPVHQNGWLCASMIAAYTGLRLESCLKLAPEHIQDNLITIMPSKTARFGRAVKIPLLRPLADYLGKLSPKSPYAPYVSCFDLPRDWEGTRLTWFSGFLKSIKITDTEEGKASFHSWRVTFVSNLSAAGVSQDVIRGIVGHASQEQTDLYNRDTSAAIRAFANLKIY